jgi:hypothetical protein
MQEVRAQAVIAGTSFEFDRATLERRAALLEPEPVRMHFVVVGGTRFPPKQIIAEATGVDRNDFTTNQARAVLRRLGFPVGRTGGPPGGTHAAEATVPYRTGGADALRPHRGRWVAVSGDEVLVAGDSPEDVHAWLVRHDRKGAIFRVPLDPEADIGGFAG